MLTEDGNDNDNNEEEDTWINPVPNFSRRQSSNLGQYYQFFPMHFDKGYGGPGAATAIANAFSTGKGGMATSTATAYGSPPIQQRGQWKRKAYRY